MKLLFIIPARGGSKGIPGKNVKELAGKPLIYYSIDAARHFVKDDFICLTTDSEEIIQKAEDYGLKVPFKRPPELATDTVSSYDAIVHALKFYEKAGHKFDAVVLLQPTSPLRKIEHVEGCINLFDKESELVVSVKEADANPYYNLFEENKDGYLGISKANNNITRRQDAPSVFQFNGSIYVFNPESLKNLKSIWEYKKIKKFIMPREYSVDLDEPVDWEFCEFLIQKGYIKV